jgi:hypothetical protein
LLALALGSLTLAGGGMVWWKSQLPGRLAQAAAAGRLEDCLRIADRLAALRWLPGGDKQTQQEGTCRRERARQLWEGQRRREALVMQHQLAASPAGTPADRQRLTLWQEEVRRDALVRFRAGDLEGALAALKPLEGEHRREGRSLGDDLRAIWNRNRLQNERAAQLIGQRRWWEALDALNRIDHPWWQARSEPLRSQVRQALARMQGAEREHDAHGELPHTVPADRLDALVQRRIAGGMDEWKAFQEACGELGGRVVEAGPESACQR